MKLFAILTLTATLPAGAAETPNHPPPTNALTVTPALINQLADEMRTNHPALRAARFHWDAARENANAVRTWEDPKVRGGVMFADVGMRADEGDIVYGVEQTLPLWGKPQLERRMAEAEAAKEESSADYQFQTLRRNLAKVLFSTALAEHTVEVGVEDLSWLDSMEATLEQRYRVGEVGQVWLLRVQNDRAKRIEQLRTDRAKLDNERVTVNRLLNRNLLEPWPSLRLPEPAGSIVFSAQLLSLAMQGEPRLKMVQKEITMAGAAVAVTKKKLWPDVMVAVENRNFSGTGDWRQTELMVGLNLPLWNRGKYRSEVAREKARLAAVEAERHDYELELRQEIHTLTVRIDAARREALLYRNEIVPRSEQAVASAQAAWTTGRGMFLDLLEARRMLLEARFMYARAVAEQYQMLSELALCCGLGDLGALERLGALPAETPATPSQPNARP
jgi:outer membrane protein TolC